MDQALAVLERDLALHLTRRCTERELAVLEEALGRRLPAAFRALLARIGGGILYNRHEIFGGQRLMVHDIELVPDLVSIRRRLEADGPRWPDHLIPFHRAQGIVHLLDTSRGEGPVPVQSETGQAYRDLAEFLEAVVLPGRGAPTLDAP